jgi:class 3 adenylate cyclase
MVSATLISFAVLAIFRSRQKQDVILFVSEMERQRVQRSLIESQQQLVDQLRTFLPKEIYGRVEIQMRSLGRTALQATDEVLRPRRVVGSVLFTDIRGFTKMTKRGGDTLVSAVIPAQKMCTDSVERHRGIPKLQGDLVYAYYDLDDSAQNLKNAILSALEINEETSDLNTSLRPEDRIIRYAIISYGDLLVGNLGGSEGSRDITVLGDAANIPSRIDAITKAPDLAKLLSERPIILTEAAMGALGAKSAQLDLVPISLPDIGLTLRDFPEQTRLFLLRASRQNHEQISAWNKQPGVEEQTRPVTMNERTAA